MPFFSMVIGVVMMVHRFWFSKTKTTGSEDSKHTPIAHEFKEETGETPRA